MGGGGGGGGIAEARFLLIAHEYKIPSNQFSSSKEKLHSWLFWADVKTNAAILTLRDPFAVPGPMLWPRVWKAISDH
jgi:hypothetical protein